MDMKTFSRREKAARLSEKLLAIEEKRNQGQRGCKCQHKNVKKFRNENVVF